MSILSKAVKDAAHEGDEMVEDIGRDGKKVVTRLVNAVDSYEKSLIRILDDLSIGLRPLRDTERALLQGVYQSSLPPLGNILICSLSGPTGRPFTVAASFFEAIVGYVMLGCGPLLQAAVVELIGKRLDQYILFMGKSGYNNDVNGYVGYGTYLGPAVAGEILVHEACHTWQGYHEVFTWSYICNSLWNQCCYGAASYDVPAAPTEQWQALGVEQEAIIVQRWFHWNQGGTVFGQAPTGPNPYDPYMTSNVQRGKPYARTTFPSN